MNIFNTNLDDSSAQCLESLRKQNLRQEQPIILREALNATLNFAKIFFSKDEPVRHYARISVHKTKTITEQKIH